MADIVCNGYKIGYTINNLIALSQLGVAIPDQVVYRPTSVYYTRADFSRVGDGFASTQWIWDMISIYRLSNLLSFLENDTFANVYIVSDKRSGIYSSPTFTLFSATMWRPILSGEEGVSVARSPYVMQTVSIQFVDLVEQIGYI